MEIAKNRGSSDTATISLTEKRRIEYISIIGKFTKSADNTLHDKLNRKSANIPSTGTVCNLYETPPQCYQWSGPLVPIVLCWYIPYQQDIYRLLKNFNMKVFHRCILLILAVDLVKEYQHSPRFKKIYPYIGQNQLQSLVSAQRVKTEVLDYSMINKIILPHQYTRKGNKITPNILLVLP